ncbi:MAG: hypothetical protein AAFW98_11925, partial [Pseudomonadota bacterium]
PRAAAYFDALADGLRARNVAARLCTVSSNAGLFDEANVRHNPVRTALSTPAALGIEMIVVPASPALCVPARSW